MMNLRFAHISDLHFGSFSLSPSQFFSKRWLGNFNYFFKRKRFFDYNRLIELIDLFKRCKITHVIITGDLSVTGLKREFQMGLRFLDLLKKEGLTPLIIPGNHDHYTKTGHRKKLFYQFFESRFDESCPLNLKDHKVTYTRISPGIWIIALDTSVATSLVSSQGFFSPELEENLEKALALIPKEDKIILLNHFPFFQNDSIKKQLVRGPLLKNLISKHQNILLYLHGHTHRQTIADLRSNDLPIISDAGCTPHLTEGACHLFYLEKDHIQLDVYRFNDQWSQDQTHIFKENDKTLV